MSFAFFEQKKTGTFKFVQWPTMRPTQHFSAFEGLLQGPYALWSLFGGPYLMKFLDWIARPQTEQKLKLVS